MRSVKPRTPAVALAASLVMVGVGCGDADDQASVAEVETGAPRSHVESAGWRANVLPGLCSALGVQDATYEFIIPPGAGDALAAGEPLRIVPAFF